MMFFMSTRRRGEVISVLLSFKHFGPLSYNEPKPTEELGVDTVKEVLRDQSGNYLPSSEEITLATQPHPPLGISPHNMDPVLGKMYLSINTK